MSEPTENLVGKYKSVLLCLLQDGGWRGERGVCRRRYSRERSKNGEFCENKRGAQVLIIANYIAWLTTRNSAKQKRRKANIER